MLHWLTWTFGVINKIANGEFPAKIQTLPRHPFKNVTQLHYAGRKIISFLPIKKVRPYLHPFSVKNTQQNSSPRSDNEQGKYRWVRYDIHSANFHETHNSSTEICENLLCQTASYEKCTKFGKNSFTQLCKSSAFTAPTQGHYKIFCSVFHQNQSRNLKISGTNSLMYIRIVWPSLGQISITHACLQCSSKNPSIKFHENLANSLPSDTRSQTTDK
jgi:hypothetical protein